MKSAATTCAGSASGSAPAATRPRTTGPSTVDRRSGPGRRRLGDERRRRGVLRGLHLPLLERWEAVAVVLGRAHQLYKETRSHTCSTTSPFRRSMVPRGPSRISRCAPATAGYRTHGGPRGRQVCARCRKTSAPCSSAGTTRTVKWPSTVHGRADRRSVERPESEVAGRRKREQDFMKLAETRRKLESRRADQVPRAGPGPADPPSPAVELPVVAPPARAEPRPRVVWLPAQKPTDSSIRTKSVPSTRWASRAWLSTIGRPWARCSESGDP